MDMIAPMTVIETPSFLRDVKGLMDEQEREALVVFLAYNPTAGVVLKGTGGVRKIRWARKGGGKSGGFRVIYFFHSENIPLFVLNIFAKNNQENITQTERSALKELTAILVKQYQCQQVKEDS
jgi:hypothetical protein